MSECLLLCWPAHSLNSSVMRTGSQVDEGLPSTLRSLVRSIQAEGAFTISVSLLIMSCPSFSSSSWKLPLQRVLNSFRLKACRATIMMVIGYDIIAKGREWTVSRSTIIQQSDPKQKEASPIRKQTQVPLVLSNLRKYERTSPGKSAAVSGSQAQRRYSSGVMEGMTSMSGFWKRLMIQLLYEIFSTQCTTTPTKIYSKSRLTNRFTPTDKDLILRSFIRATVEQIAIMSFTNHCPLSSQQSGMKSKPTPYEITSISLNHLYTFFRQFLLWLSQIVSDMHTPTPRAPTMLPKMRASRETISGTTYPKIMKKSSPKLKIMIALLDISYPTPPYDHALLYSDPSVSTRVAIMMSSSNPHSNGLQNWSGLQFMRYSNSPTEVTTFTWLICGDNPHRLLRVMLHWVALQLGLNSARIGDRTPQTDVIWQPWASMIQLL